MKEIVHPIHTRGDPSWVQSVVSWGRSPWIESPAGLELIRKQKDPCVYTSHLPMQFFPKSLFTSKAKVIYIMRNPRDVIISGYHFHKTLKITRNPNSLEEYFEWFLRGNAPDPQNPTRDAMASAGPAAPVIMPWRRPISGAHSPERIHLESCQNSSAQVAGPRTRRTASVGHLVTFLHQQIQDVWALAPWSLCSHGGL